MKRITLILVSSILCFFTANAQTDNLFKAIQGQDSIMFNITFNTCDLGPLEELVSENFEFYHDKGGITMGKRAFINSLKNGLCAHPERYQSRRELVKGSMEVYPLAKDGVIYGAIQSGRHRFYETNKGQPERFASIARFTHLWLLEAGKWRFARGLSFDHQTTDAPDKEATTFENEEGINQWLAQNHIPALGVGIIRDGKLKEINVYGEIKKGETAPYNALFNVASLTKPVVAILTLRLVSAGKWKLDEPLANYWIDPDLKNDPRHAQLTTRHVLSHQTGFPNWRRNNPTQKLAFNSDPGTAYGYSGEGLEYLRKALEKKFKKSLDQLAKEWVLEPIGMKDTHFYWDGSFDESRFAVGYNTQGIPYNINKNTAPNAADDLVTTIEDYGKFLVSVLNNEGLSKAVAEEMVKHQVKTKENKYFGLGWEMYELANGDYALSHGGADEGVKTLVFIFPKTREGLLIFTNADDGYKAYDLLVQSYLKDQGKPIIDIEMGKK